MQNPFTSTYSKLPEYTYITTDEPAEIIDNFRYESPSESVYKITGVRGSGKTVVLAKVEEEYRSEENQKRGWLVYSLAPTRDMLRQLAAMMYKEAFIKNRPASKSLSVNANVLGTGGGIGIGTSERTDLFDIGVEIEEMLQEITKQGKKVLIGIDEVSRTKEMIEFASEFGKWLRQGYPVYLVCTGLYENMQELSNVKNLTFFRRATTIKTKPLNAIRIAGMYKSKLHVDAEEANRMAEMTMGYAYAFQELGILYFKKDREETLEDLVELLKSELFAYSYEKIWEELSDMDRDMLRLLTDKSEYKREEIVERMGERAGNYSVYRDRLLKRGIIDSRRAHVSLALPFFADYIKEYCS